MANLRFSTDQSLLDAFPGAARHVKTKPKGAGSLDFLAELLERGAHDDAISFCAYLLPRRQAVVWGCRMARAATRDADTGPGHDALLAAEAWARDPDEERRRRADLLWTKGDKEDPRIWLTLAAAGSSNPPTDPPQNLTAIAVRVALLLTLHKLPASEKIKYARDCVVLGMQLAETGP